MPTQTQGHFKIVERDDTGGQHYMHDEVAWDVIDTRTDKVLHTFHGTWMKGSDKITSVTFDGDKVVAKDSDGKTVSTFELPKE